MPPTYEPGHVSGFDHPGDAVEQQPPPGQASIMLAALLVGILLMSIQLWLLTVALDLFLSGKGQEVWQLALLSGLIFAGGLVMTRLSHRRPHVRRGDK